MKDLLFLAHRIPYPPHKGDKVRSYHLLKHLCRRYRVYLGTFVDDRADWRYAERVRALCAGAYFARLTPAIARMRSLSALVTGEPVTLAYFRSPGLRAWVEHTLETHAIERLLIVSSAMAQYLPARTPPRSRGVLDLVDVDSQKWCQYARGARGPARWVYAREGRKLLAYERASAARADAAVLVSAREAALFRTLAPEQAARISHVANGVDADYFSPMRRYPDPYAAGERALVFTGVMDYRANVDAVRWFAREVFPAIGAHDPRVRFYVVGARPVAAVRRLVRIPGVRVTGAVADVRPYLAHAVAAVAPLRIARGVQNKVLEAMAMGRAVLATPAAMEGLEDFPGDGVMVAQDPELLSDGALALLGEPQWRAPRLALREFVAQHHDWGTNLGGIVRLLEGVTGEAVGCPSSRASA